MNSELLKETLRRELPGLLRRDPSFRTFILELTRQEYADRRDTHDRFYEILAELRRDREAQTRKWEEQNRKWDDLKAEWARDREEQARKWDDQNRKWDDLKAESARDREEQARKWDEQNRKWDDQKAEWARDREEQARKWDDQNRKWNEFQAETREEFQRVHEEIMAQAQKHDRGIGALGSRWGIQTEAAFRNALAGILEKSFGVQVLNVNEYDDEGVVFGRPEQIEIDIIVKNGLLLICELKSSIDKGGMYSFERKARFYEKRHQRQANRLLVISPMVDARAQKVAEALGIEVYSDSVDVKEI
jgi:hypothetical protein